MADVIYQVRSEEDLNELLARLKEVGYMWASGRDLVNDSLVSWNRYGIYTCIHVHSDQKWLSYSDLDFFANELEIPVKLYTKGMELLK